ncbi:hypothetical protein NE237_029441 [Protea cynaroides]|uniref:Sulfotransferase n=1 Tax=Protea cynaroides TaxID=273540 RepID=A0A9Q0JTX3_9MAGN|nr:hypothetical protein NE237_029441 [Protea cynaroides]
MEITKSLLMTTSDSLKPFLDELPRVNWWGDFALYQWEGAIEAQWHFKAHDDDVILASSMKTGTTWTKALVACIMSRPCPDNINGMITKDPSKQLEDPLVTKNPSAYGDPTPPDLSGIPYPRLFHTHMPYKVLPESIKNSECKIVYVTRNPKDTFMSLWHFRNTVRTAEQGPFPILKRPEKILMLKYEELKRDPRGEVKRLSSFLGRPLFELLDVNKNGIDPWIGVTNSSFFKFGAVGDWKNYFSSEMKERLDQLTHQKLQGSGLCSHHHQRLLNPHSKGGYSLLLVRLMEDPQPPQDN